MTSTGSAQDDLQVGDVLTDPVGDGRNYTWDGEAWRSSDTVILSGSKTAGVSANGQQITIYDAQNSAFMNSTFISVGVNLASVGFRAHKNGVNQTGMTGGAVHNKITFMIEEYDRGNYYDAPNSRWTPPAGLVHIDGSIYASGLTGDTVSPWTLQLHLYKNGVLVKRTATVISTTGTYQGTQISVDDLANGTDYYELYMSSLGPGPFVVEGPPSTFFCGHSVGGQGPQGIQGPTGPISPTWALLPTGFRANRNTVDQTGLVSGVYTKINFDTEIYDQGSYYDPVLSRWTPPAGMVHIDAGVLYTGTLTSGAQQILSIYKNSVVLGNSVELGANTSAQGVGISIDDLASGSDYYEMYGYVTTTAGTGTVSGITRHSYFNGHMLGGPQGVPGPQGIPGAVDGLVSRVAFSAYKNVDQTGIATETWTKVLFQATDFNDATRYNVGTSRWVPPSGRCQITGSVGFSVASSTLLIGTPLLICVYKNGSIYKVAVGSSLSTAFASVNITIIDSCNGTDYYEIGIYLYTNTTATIPALNASMYTYFQGVQL